MIAWPEVVTLDIENDAASNAAIVLETEHSRYPVVRRSDDSVIGVLLTKDIFGAMLSGQPSPWENLRQYLREPLLIPESVGLSRVMEQMRQRRMHMAIIVDEYGQMSGVVTLEDLLEEITGEIHDETDTAEEVHHIREDSRGTLGSGRPGAIGRCREDDRFAARARSGDEYTVWPVHGQPRPAAGQG